MYFIITDDNFMSTMKDIISSPLLLALVIIGLLYIVGFSLVYLKKAYTHCIELGISKSDIKNVIKSSIVFSIVPSLSIVVGLFALISVLGTVWSWWRLSVIGSLSYESLISSSAASAIGFSSSAEMLTGLVIAVALGLLAKNPKLAWLNDFIMAFSMIGGMISSVFWCKLFL